MHLGISSIYPLRRNAFNHNSQLVKKAKQWQFEQFYLKEAEESSGSSSLLYDSGVAQDQDSQDPDSRSSSPEMITRGWLKTSGVGKVGFSYLTPCMTFLIQNVC